MELHRLNRKIAVTHAHDDAVFGLRSHFEARWQLFTDRVKRVIASDLHPRGQAGKDAAVRVPDVRRLAMHRVVENTQLAAECFHRPLQSEADAEYGNPPLGCVPDRVGDTKIAW